MILKPDFDGIVFMVNVHTKTPRSAIIVHANIDLKGPVHVVEEKVVMLGYNERIVCDTEENAMILFEKIHDVLTKG